jgi:citrate synthase
MIQGQGQLYRRPAHECLMNTVRGPEQLFDSEDRWVTSMGAWFPGKRVVLRGQDLFHDLKELSWMALLLYAITGRILDERQVRLFEGIWRISSSYPEPRLWNNRIAALAVSVRSTGSLGVSAGIAVSEATIYGQGPLIRAMEFLLRAQEQLNQGINLTDVVLAELKKYRGIAGFGRPIIRTDERIAPLMALVEELGYGDGVYVNLVFEIEKILLAGGWRLHMNIAALDAALAADQGLTVGQFYMYMILCFTAGIVPCAIDASRSPAGTFFPLRCNRIQYKGRPHRLWERHS